MPYKSKQKQKEYQQTHYKKYKKYYGERQKARRKAWNKWVREIKEERGPCKDCGYSDPRALQFHHSDPSAKEFTIGSTNRSGGCRKDKVLIEINKCIVLCANCHMIRHAAK